MPLVLTKVGTKPLIIIIIIKVIKTKYPVFAKDVIEDHRCCQDHSGYLTCVHRPVPPAIVIFVKTLKSTVVTVQSLGFIIIFVKTL